MKIGPQSTWDRDPLGTYLKMLQEVNRDYGNGYLTPTEKRRLISGMNKCYVKGLKRKAEK